MRTAFFPLAPASSTSGHTRSLALRNRTSARTGSPARTIRPGVSIASHCTRNADGGSGPARSAATRATMCIASMLTREVTQRSLEHGRELGVLAEILARVFERDVGVLRAIAEVDQRGVDVVVDRWADRNRRSSHGAGHELVAQLEADPLRRLLPDARNRRELARVAARDGIGEIVRVDARQNLLRDRRPDARDRDQFLERELLLRRRESVQRQRVFADVRVDVERHLALSLALVVRGE